MFRSLSPGTIGVKATLDEGLELARRGGFQGLDINIVEVAGIVRDRGAAAVTDRFREAGLKIGAWGLPVSWNGSEEDYRRGLAGLEELAAAGAAVGAFRVAQWVPAASENLPFRENFRWHVDRLKPIAEILSGHGCRLGLEFIGPRTIRADKPYGFIYTMPGMLALSEAIGTGNVGLLLDCWHWYTSLGTLSDLRALSASDVVHVHVNDAPSGVDVAEQVDNVRALPSETGVIDLPGFLGILKEIDYDGPVTPEPFSQRVRQLPPDQAVRETHKGLYNAWQEARLQ